jgi:transcriptional regulator with XRE-family HTH domain
MSQEDLFINGELLRLGREARGWVLSDMATRACMSVKQIRQLEEGGTSAFYSPAVKMTSAKKLAGILELSADQVFNRPAPEATDIDMGSLPTPAREDDDFVNHPVATASQSVVEEADSQPLQGHEELASSPSAPDESKPKTSLWMIVGLFVAALAVAAYMQKQEEPATEPPPPLQVVAPEPEAAASAAELAASSASAAVAETAASAASVATTPVPAPAPASSAPASAVKPTVSSASKPL